MNKQNTKWLEKNKNYFIGAFELVDENLSDGAYLQMRIDFANNVLKDWKEISMDKPPKNIDAYDISMGLMRTGTGEYVFREGD